MAQRIRILSPPNVPSRHQNFRLLFYGRLYNLHIHKSTQQDSVLSEECVQRILKCRSNVTQIVIVRWNISAALLLIKHTEKKGFMLCDSQTIKSLCLSTAADDVQFDGKIVHLHGKYF